MEKLNFKLSDSQKFDALWSLLNTEYNEANGWVITYAICDVFDEYALAFSYEENCYERVYYTKNDEEDSIIINEKKKCYVIDVTESEKAALDSLRAFNGGTYEKVDEKISIIDNLTEENTAFSTKIEELELANATLTTERDEVATNYTNAQTEISNLNSELEGLKEFKLNTEMQEKKNIIDSYSELLSEEVLEKYTDEKLTEYTIIELDKELAYELKNSNPSVFTKTPQYIPKDDTMKSGIEAILDKYKK